MKKYIEYLTHVEDEIDRYAEFFNECVDKKPSNRLGLKDHHKDAGTLYFEFGGFKQQFDLLEPVLKGCDDYEDAKKAINHIYDNLFVLTISYLRLIESTYNELQKS